MTYFSPFPLQDNDVIYVTQHVRFMNKYKQIQTNSRHPCCSVGLIHVVFVSSHWTGSVIKTDIQSVLKLCFCLLGFLKIPRFQNHNSLHIVHHLSQNFIHLTIYCLDS